MEEFEYAKLVFWEEACKQTKNDEFKFYASQMIDVNNVLIFYSNSF